MKEFLQDIGSLHWWIGIVVVGILLNLFSAYLKVRIDKSLSSASTWWRRRTEAQEAKRAATIDKVRADFREESRFATEEMRQRFLAVKYFIVTVLSFLIYSDIEHTLRTQTDDRRLLLLVVQVVFLFISALSILVGTRCFITATQMRVLLADAAKEVGKDEAPDDVH